MDMDSMNSTTTRQIDVEEKEKKIEGVKKR